MRLDKKDLISGYTGVDNKLLIELMGSKCLSLKVRTLFIVWRMTFGFNRTKTGSYRKESKISVQSFKSLLNEPVSWNIKTALNSLVKEGLIVERKVGKESFWSVQDDPTKWKNTRPVKHRTGILPKLGKNRPVKHRTKPSCKIQDGLGPFIIIIKIKDDFLKEVSPI